MTWMKAAEKACLDGWGCLRPSCCGSRCWQAGAAIVRPRSAQIYIARSLVLIALVEAPCRRPTKAQLTVYGKVFDGVRSLSMCLVRVLKDGHGGVFVS